MAAKKRSFLFDRMLGKLCTKMRMLGYDSMLNPEGENGRFFLNAAGQGRTAVTRSRGMRDRPGPQPIILRTEDTLDQIVELFKALREAPLFEPFSRCLECNALLAEEPAEAVRDEVPPYVERSFQRFHRCPGCRRIYWEGTHFMAMKDDVAEIERRLKGA